jgi:ABC-type phosphate/phosphonate transport system ATPase subunit
MDITMIGLQNAGKTSLLRVLAVSLPKTVSNLVIVRALTFLQRTGR